MPWKKWVESQYGLPLSREGVRRLARLCHEQHKIPNELTQKIRALIAYAGWLKISGPAGVFAAGANSRGPRVNGVPAEGAAGYSFGGKSCRTAG